MKGPDDRRSAAGELSVLIEEYRALRSEVTQRIGASATLVGFVAAGAGLVSTSDGGGRTWAAVVVLAAIVVGVWGTNQLKLLRLGRRLKSLEQTINDAAARAYGLDQGRVLLSWEGILDETGTWLQRSAKRFGPTGT